MSKTNEFLNMCLQILSCTLCDLYKSRRKVVIGRGSLSPKIVFIGESAGEDEDKCGIPFVGRSGELLNRWIIYLNIHKRDYTVTNIVKCHPENNRDPHPNEIKICTETWLEKQLEYLNPKIIVSVGRISTAYFLGKNFETGITKYCGKFYRDKFRRMIYPLVHPSYFLRNPNKKRLEIEQLQVLKGYING